MIQIRLFILPRYLEAILWNSTRKSGLITNSFVRLLLYFVVSGRVPGLEKSGSSLHNFQGPEQLDQQALSSYFLIPAAYDSYYSTNASSNKRCVRYKTSFMRLLYAHIIHGIFFSY